MSRLAALKSAATLSDLAALLRFKPAALAFLLYRLPATNKYTTFTVPKRDGGVRTVSAPISQLKRAQRNLASLLHDCWDEHGLSSGRYNNIAHGFMRNRSIYTNARKHRNRNYVFNVDLRNFFPSLNFGRVRGYFLKDATFSLNPDIATMIARIACHQNELPQGSPCSPIISNLIGHILDIQLVALAAKHGCTYSRYADDLTFSTNDMTFPPSIAQKCRAEPHKWQAGSRLTQIVMRNGFSLNAEKTRMQYRDSRQAVTGLTVNRKVNVPREYRAATRAMVHNLLRKGTFEIRGPTGELKPGTLSQLYGRLTFIDSVDLRNRLLLLADAKKGHLLGKSTSEMTLREFGTKSPKDLGPLTSGEQLFGRFLIYKDFFVPPKPVIVCEGKTDNVYLLHAIHRLDRAFPELIERIDARTSRLKVRLYKYVDTRVGRILRLGSGGGSALKGLIERYLKETSRFLALPSEHPFIVLVDNDCGSDIVANFLLKNHRIELPTNGDFVHVSRNLYVMRTPPLPGKASTVIEDFFDTQTKAMSVEGKTFHLGKDLNSDQHYGKTVFAHKVVRANAATIDFSGFAPILKKFVEIQKHYTSTR